MAITDWESFEAFSWPDPEHYDNSRITKIKPYLPDGMKLMVFALGGLLENTVELTGYENLCYMLYDEPELVKEITDHLGSRLLRYYIPAIQNENVGMICISDDWGFNTQTRLSPADLRKYYFPWYRKIMEEAHKYNKPCVLHSCGYFEPILDDIVYDLKIEARHSYEDNILPVEEAYEKYHDKIAIMGGMDLDFVCRETPENVYRRSREMLERTADRGGYALGTGNSVPDYVPYENYRAMVRAAWDFD